MSASSSPVVMGKNRMNGQASNEGSWVRQGGDDEAEAVYTLAQVRRYEGVLVKCECQSDLEV